MLGLLWLVVLLLCVLTMDRKVDPVLHFRQCPWSVRSPTMPHQPRHCRGLLPAPPTCSAAPQRGLCPIHPHFHKEDTNPCKDQALPGKFMLTTLSRPGGRCGPPRSRHQHTSPASCRHQNTASNMLSPSANLWSATEPNPFIHGKPLHDCSSHTHVGDLTSHRTASSTYREFIMDSSGRRWSRLITKNGRARSDDRVGMDLKGTTSSGTRASTSWTRLSKN